MTMGMPGLDGFTKQVEAGFRGAYRRNLHAAQLFAYTPTTDLGIDTFEWHTLGDTSGGVKVTQEIPALEGGGSAAVTTASLKIPVLTKDRTWGRRAFMAYKRGGLDLQDASQDGKAMAEELNDILYFGVGAGKFGPTTGLLNDPGIQVVDNSATTNWNNPTDVSDDLSAAVKQLMLHGHVPTSQVGPGVVQPGRASPRQYVFLMHLGDSDLMTKWRSETDRQTKDMLPDLVSQPLYDSIVTSAGKDAPAGGKSHAYLIAVSPDNFDVVGTTAPGQVETLVDDPGEQGIKMGKPIWVRHMASFAPRILDPSSVVKVVFDRSD